MRARHFVAALGAAILAGVAPGTALAGDPTMVLSELRPGMQCTGYSVIRGTEISAFDVEILDVVSGDASANDGPRILIRVSGDAVDRTGVGPGFSGSPIYCDGRNAGAISEAIGEYGGKTVLATPIGEILANPPDAPRGKPIAPRSARRARIVRVLPLAEPLDHPVEEGIVVVDGSQAHQEGIDRRQNQRAPDGRAETPHLQVGQDESCEEEHGRVDEKGGQAIGQHVER